MGHSNDLLDISYGLQGVPFGTLLGPVRRKVLLEISGISADGHGRLEVLKHLLREQLPLVRLPVPPRHWVYDKAVKGGRIVEWTDQGLPVDLTDGGQPVDLFDTFKADGTPGVDAGLNYVDVTGLPPNVLVSVPGMAVSSGGARALATGRVRSDGNGNARIYLTAAVSPGQVITGMDETVVFLITNQPFSVQRVGSDHTTTFELTEQFEAQFDGGFQVLDPWR